MLVVGRREGLGAPAAWGPSAKALSERCLLNRKCYDNGMDERDEDKARELEAERQRGSGQESLLDEPRRDAREPLHTGRIKDEVGADYFTDSLDRRDRTLEYMRVLDAVPELNPSTWSELFRDDRIDVLQKTGDTIADLQGLERLDVKVWPPKELSREGRLEMVRTTEPFDAMYDGSSIWIHEGWVSTGVDADNWDKAKDPREAAGLLTHEYRHHLQEALIMEYNDKGAEADLRGVSPATVQAWIDAGPIPRPIAKPKEYRSHIRERDARAAEDTMWRCMS